MLHPLSLHDYNWLSDRNRVSKLTEGSGCTNNLCSANRDQKHCRQFHVKSQASQMSATPNRCRVQIINSRCSQWQGLAALMRKYYSKWQHHKRRLLTTGRLISLQHTVWDLLSKRNGSRCLVNMQQIHTQVITCKAKIKYVALLNVPFYKWLGYPAGISGWHCAAVTTTVSPTHACLSMGALFSKVKCQMLSIPTRRERPGAPSGGTWRPCFSADDGKTPLLNSFCFWSSGASTTAPWQPYYYGFDILPLWTWILTVLILRVISHILKNIVLYLQPIQAFK